MKAEIISIGTELLLGEITDLNAAYLASQLPLLGLDLHFISTVGDNKQRIIETLNHSWQRSDIIITTGGLGPTEDDITRESIAEFFNEKITIDESLVQQFRQLFKQFGVEMPKSNIKQASVIPSCQIIPNPRGTAPGWWVERDKHVIVAMPGPPGEMQQMWTAEVAPRIQSKFCDAVIYSDTLKVFGMTEAAIGEITKPYLLANNPTVGIYAKADGIHLRVTAKSESVEQARKLVDKTTREIRELLGDQVWGSGSDTLETLVTKIFIEKKLTLVTLEAGTGGVLANNITSVVDSPKFYKCGIVVSHCNMTKEFGVNETIISQYGATSKETAREMATAIRRRFNTSVGLGLIGILDTQDPGYKLGTVLIGIDNGVHNHVFERILPGTRAQIRQRAAISALFELRKIMQ